MKSARPPLVVHDARTNNLTGVTVSIPSPALTVVTGVSGSGKSSLVFETIAKESQRQLNEVFRCSSATGCRSSSIPTSSG